jgi:hypothetical protein
MLCWKQRRRLRSCEVEAIEIHNLVPCSDEITHELLLGIDAPVDLGDRPEFGVRAEDEVDPGAGPPELSSFATATLEDILGVRDRSPFRRDVEQVHKEVVGQGLVPVLSIRLAAAAGEARQTLGPT